MVIYVGCADDSQFDQVLEEFIVPPLPKGIFKRGQQVFEFSVSPPDPDKLPSYDEIIGTTVLMFTVFYRRQEFFRCSYFVYNNYLEERQSKREEIELEDVVRSVLVEHPKIRAYEIVWDYPQQQEQQNGNSEVVTERKKKVKKRRSKRASKKR